MKNYCNNPDYDRRGDDGVICSRCRHSKTVEHGNFISIIEEYEHTDLVCMVTGDIIDNELIAEFCEEWEED